MCKSSETAALGVRMSSCRTLNLQLFLLCAICVQQVRIHIVSINKYICKVLWNMVYRVTDMLYLLNKGYEVNMYA